MATELEGNIQLQRFIELLAKLNHQCVDAIKSGNTKILDEMNSVIEEMHAIQSVGEEDAYTAIDDEMQAIVKNFNASVVMMQSAEGKKDATTETAVKKFVKNIFDSTVKIITAYGLV
jgi:hypothetical protein